MFHHVGLIAKTGDPRVNAAMDRLVAYLGARGVRYTLQDRCPPLIRGREGATGMDLEAMGDLCDLAIVVGGDGTLLSAARVLVDHGVRILGINLGRLGFLTDISPEELEASLDTILGGDFLEEERFLLDAHIYRGDQDILHGTALNDVIIHKWQIARLVEFDTYIDGVFVHHQRSDGMVIATPTGSTAYALSGGGPILHPQLDAIVLVPICPHTLSNRPIVVNSSSVVEVRLGRKQQTSAQLTCDGQTTLDLDGGDRVVVRRKERPIRLIHPPGHDHYAVLRSKLHWGHGL